MAWRLASLLLLAACAQASEPFTTDLHPTGGGHFTISLLTCQDSAAVLNGSLANRTDATWLYIEIEIKVSRGSSTATYRLNLERIGPNGGPIRQRIEGAAGQDCSAFRIDSVKLISAHSDARAAEKKR